jgi:hypothetical protein
MLTAPSAWYWNRAEDSTQFTQPSKQDYTYTIPNLGYIELVTLVDPNGKSFQIKDVYNYDALAPLGAGAVPQRPQAACLVFNTIGSGFTLRFMGMPDQVYKIIITYQQASIQFQSFAISAVLLASGGQTTYNGVFNTLSFPLGSDVLVSSCTTAANNGTFQVISVTTSQLVLNNPSGVAETAPAGAVATNIDWSPLPDTYSDIYNNLFLGESMAMVDDMRSTVYRHRGVAAFLAKAEGLTDTQKNIFAQQWIVQGREASTVALKLQQATSLRGEQ